MAEITGIGGVFFRAQDPEALGQWYKAHLGIDPFRPPWQQQAGPTVFALFEAQSDYFPADRTFMINFRVTDLDAMMARLREGGVTVETREEWDSEIGRFARIHDPEGNPIELWQPPPDADIV